MKPIKVIVDELPKKCKHCQFSDFGLRGGGLCEITKKTIYDGTPFEHLPSWCPLVTVGNVVQVARNYGGGDGLFIWLYGSLEELERNDK